MSEEMAQENQEQPAVEAKNEIDMAAYEKMRNDMHKFKRQFMEIEKEKAEYAAKVKELEEDRLKSSENYKELWEKEKAQGEQWKSKFDTLQNNLVEDKKRSKVVEHALKAGFDKEFLDLLDAFDMSDVLVERTDSGKFIVNGADTWVNSLKAERPKLFTERKSDPKINNKTGNYDGREKTYSMSEVLELQKSDYAKYQDIIANKRHLITK